MIVAIQDSLIDFNLAPMLAKLFFTFACPHFPSIGLRSPGLTGIDDASALGRPNGFARNFKPKFF